MTGFGDDGSMKIWPGDEPGGGRRRRFRWLWGPRVTSLFPCLCPWPGLCPCREPRPTLAGRLGIAGHVSRIHVVEAVAGLHAKFVEPLRHPLADVGELRVVGEVSKFLRVGF
jgi:hypothetical protein